MAWPAGGPGTAVAGNVATASFVNTNYRDALDALNEGHSEIASQAAGDVLYASSATQLGRVGLTSGQAVISGGSGAPTGEYVLPTSENTSNQLDNGDDLDNITTRGLYHWAGNSLPTNAPSGFLYTSMLVTVDASQPQQLVWSGQNGSFRMAMRRRDGGTWTSWKEAFSIANPPAFTNISGSIADGQVPESAVTQHVDVLDEYGALYGNTQSTVTISSQNAYTVVDALDTNGQANSVTQDPTTNHDLTVTVAGIYVVAYNIGGSRGGSTDFTAEFAVHVDGSEAAQTRQRTAVGNAVEHKAASVGLLNLSGGTEAVDLRIRNVTNTENFTVEDVSLALWRIS